MTLGATASSINILAALHIIICLFSVFFVNRARTTLTWLLVGFFGGILITLCYLCFVYSALQRCSPAFEYVHFLALGVSSICLLQIPYRLHHTFRQRESRTVLALSVAAHLYVLVYVALFMESSPVTNFDSHFVSYPVRHIERINIVFIADYLVAIALLTRNFLELSDYCGSFPSALFARKHPLRHLGAQFAAAALKFAHPGSDLAALNRDGVFLMCGCLGVWIALSMANHGYTEYSHFSFLVSTASLMLLLLFIVSYINWYSKKSKFMTKMLSISFVFLIVVISIVGRITLMQKEKAYDALKRSDLACLRRQIAERQTLSHINDSVAFIYASPVSGQRSAPEAYELLFRRSARFELRDYLDEEMQERRGRVKQVETNGSSQAPTEQWDRYIAGLTDDFFSGRQGFNYLGRSADFHQRYVLFDFVLGPRLYRVGYPYAEYRSFIHNTAGFFVWLLPLLSLVIVIGFPILFHINLVRPMRSLLAGVKQVNSGQLDVVVPVVYEDEIGYLTHSFNCMAASIKENTRLLETRVRQRTEEVERLNELKNRFLAFMAHDLRSPLKAIEFSVRMLKGANAPSEEGIVHAENICQTVDYMYRLLDDLSDLAMIESGRLCLEFTANDYAEFIAEKLQHKEHLALEKNIRLTHRVKGWLPRIFFDRDKMHQVLDNLIDNAIVHSSEESQVCVVVETRGRHVRTSVVDQGRGISRQDVAKVFEAYHTGASARRGQAHHGTGLGLAIVKQIIEAHRGEVGVESKLGQGTTFWFTLPVYEE